MNLGKYIFENLESKNKKEELIEFFKHQTTAEYGGYRLFDGNRNHLMHIPEELTDLLILLQDFQKKNKKKLGKFLEIGFSTGKVNTILNKFFQFEQIVAVDNFSAEISSKDLLANLVRKNLTLICGNSDTKNTLSLVKNFSSFDLVFVDGSHEYKDVKTDLKNFSKMVSKNGILIAHDIHSKEHPGVNKAWNEFKEKNNDFKFQEIFYDLYYFKCGVGIAFKKK